MIASKFLMPHFGKGWGEKCIRHCLSIAETFQREQIFYPLSKELSWAHIGAVMYMDDELKRSFLYRMCQKRSDTCFDILFRTSFFKLSESKKF